MKNPRLYATLKGSEEVRHLIVEYVRDYAETNLALFNAGIETLVATGTEFEMLAAANELIQLSSGEGFKWMPEDQLPVEPLSSIVSLAKKTWIYGHIR